MKVYQRFVFITSSVAGFSFNIANLVWPAFLIGIILIQIGKHRYIGDFLFGISFLLFALGMLNQTGRDMDLAHNPAVVNFFASFDSRVALSGFFRTFAST